MTLLELTVLALVLLSLISILIIGTRAWKRGSDAMGCRTNQRNLQTAVRTYAQGHKLQNGAPLSVEDQVAILKLAGFSQHGPTCESKGRYTVLNHVPAVGEVYLNCDFGSPGEKEHVPVESKDW